MLLNKITGFVFNQSFFLALILISALTIRLINLNYNSPFNDEAIYVVIGKMGVFAGDWGTYNAANWTAGLLNLYPAISALSYSSGGILGSRLLNVILSVVIVELLYLITFFSSRKTNSSSLVPAIITASLVAGSSIGYMVSRLATYDIPAYCLFFLGLAFLVMAEKNKTNIAKLYLLACLSLIIAYVFKIIVVLYFPFLIIYAFWRAKNISRTYRFYVLRYFIGPFIILVSLLTLLNLGSILIYLESQKVLEKVEWLTIISLALENTKYLLPFAFLGIIGLLIKREWKALVVLGSGAVLIILVHLLTFRLASLDKHLFLTICFLSILSGLGISNLVEKIRSMRWRFLVLGMVLGFLVNYSFYSYIEGLKFNDAWPNASLMLEQLNKQVKSGDKVLAEVGGAAILHTYDQNFPTNTVTFDYFDFNELRDIEAYKQAVEEGYFDWIELEADDNSKNNRYQSIHQAVVNSISDQYKLTFADSGFYIYKRSF